LTKLEAEKKVETHEEVRQGCCLLPCITHPHCRTRASYI